MSSPRNADPRPPAPPLTHRVRVARLEREGATEFRVVPDAAERERVARFLEIPAVERMAMTGRLVPAGGGWQVRGKLTATVVQECVVTLEPVRQVIDVPVRRDYMPAGAAPVHDEPGSETELRPGDLDEPDPLGPEIDLGDLAVETLTLNLDPWPRAEGAELDSSALGADGSGVAGEGDERPFAGLAELRARLTRGEG